MPFQSILSFNEANHVENLEKDAISLLFNAHTATTDVLKRNGYAAASVKFRDLKHALNTSTKPHATRRKNIANEYFLACYKFSQAFAKRISGNNTAFASLKTQAQTRLTNAQKERQNLKTVLGITGTGTTTTGTSTTSTGTGTTTTGTSTTSTGIGTSTTGTSTGTAITTTAKPSPTEQKTWDADYEAKRVVPNFVFSDYLAELIKTDTSKEAIEKRLWWAVQKPEFGDGDAVLRVDAKAQKVKTMMADTIPEDLTSLKNNKDAFMFVDTDGVTMKPLKTLDQLSKLAIIIAYTPVFPATNCENCNEFRKMMFIRTPDLSRAMIVHAMKAADFSDQLKELSSILSQWNEINAEKAIATAKTLEMIDDKFTETFIQKYSDFGKVLLYRRLNYVIACLKMRQAVDIHDTKDVLMLNDQITSLQKAITTMNIVV